MKGKEEFEKWFKIDRANQLQKDFSLMIGRNSLPYFYSLPFSMQWGVRKEFFKSVDILISMVYLVSEEKWIFKLHIKTSDITWTQFVSEKYNDEETSQKAAIEKALSLVSEPSGNNR